MELPLILAVLNIAQFVILMVGMMELVRAKSHELISNKEREQIATHAFWNGRWYERGIKQATSQKKAAR